MVLARRIRKRGATITVEAHGEVLFAPTGDVGNWTRRFTARIRAATTSEAPTNKRPRWAHYGKPLKTTMTASTSFQPVRMRVYSAVGSTSPHAYYVDQGTGVYAGGSAYVAKVLPPWTRGSPSLYERTWRPGGANGDYVKPVMIKGQKGQGFFDKGLKRGFQSMRMRSFQVPGTGSFSAPLASFPEGLANFAGNTPVDAGFIASLKEWRAWRDAAWDAGEELGRNHRRGVSRASAVAARDRLREQSRAVVAGQLASDAAKAAAARRHAAQVRAIAEEKARKAKAKAEREAKAHQFAVEAEKRLARIRAQKFANKGYTNVSLRTVFNASKTRVIGFDIYYTDLKGETHVSHLHV